MLQDFWGVSDHFLNTEHQRANPAKIWLFICWEADINWYELTYILKKD